jgi:hypothetical protein
MNVATNLRSEKGSFVPFVASALIVLGLFAGVAVDAGRAYLLRDRLWKMADAASLAGAKVITMQGDTAAIEAACDAARVNGPSIQGAAGTCPQGVVVETVPVPNTDPQQTGIKVTATAPMDTSFMRLGVLIGCGTTCERIDISTSAVAAPSATYSDVVLVIDDTQSMSGGRISNAKLGANAVVDLLLASTGTSASRVGIVPFRGCYIPPHVVVGPERCVNNADIVNLTDNRSALIAGISNLSGTGGSGSNVCIGLNEGNTRLSGVGNRPQAKKFLVVLTDAESSGTVLIPELLACNGLTTLLLDKLTNDKATLIKSSVEIFVIDYGATGAPTPPCNPSRIGIVTDYRNLAKCIASTDTTYPHYLPAPNPSDIKKQLKFIGNLLLKLRLVN